MVAPARNHQGEPRRSRRIRAQANGSYGAGCGSRTRRLARTRRHYTNAAELLEKRLHALGLSSAELAQTAQAELRDMERLCTLCQSKRRCARDLANNPDDPAWHRYCPNEQTLTSLAREGVER